ncbi:hypothetical protein ACFY2N_12310 [Streptomyces rubiginosohelvolus]|uniref:hypothetical protein n=1 Tax=Streptomyces rubiginosohelvolus TaxID=67362 RepID=UPI00367DD6C5
MIAAPLATPDPWSDPGTILTVLVGWSLSQRAQPFLFPDTSPCFGTRSTPVSQYFPPDSFCRHAYGELRTVNGPDAKLVFWTAASTTVAITGAAVVWRRRRGRSRSLSQRAAGPDGVTEHA